MLKQAAAALVALSLVTASTAMADSRRDHYWDGDRDHHVERYDRDHRHGRFRAGPYSHHHYWRREERLPAGYYAPRYIVYDYHANHLRPPPRGCHWVRVDRDAVLVAFATGVVLDAVYNRF